MVAIAPARARRPGVDRPTIPEPTAGRARRVPVLRGARGPDAAGDVRRRSARSRAGHARAGRCASSRTSTRRSSSRRSSCTPRGTRARSPSWRRTRSKPSRRPGTRAAQAASADGFAYVQVVLNEGRVAGSSLPHSHSQLVWLREPPPAVLEELPRLERGGCGVCDVLREERLEIALRGDVVALAAPAGRAPYELVIAPSRAHRRAERGGPRRRGAPPSRCDPPATRRRGPGPAQRLAAHRRALAPRARAASDRLRRPRARRRDLRQLAAPGGGRAAPQGVGSASGLPFSSRKRRAASIAAPRFRPLSLACLISITVSTASMS